MLRRGLLVAGVLASPGAWASLTGTYLAANRRQAFEIQVIETPHHRLVGHFVEIAFNSSAQNTRTDASVSGRVSGDLVVMTLKTQAFLSAPITLSGSIHGHRLTLRGGGGGSTMRLAMIRANQTMFSRIVATLRQHVEAAAAAAQKARRQKEQKAADMRLVGHLRNWETWIKTLPSRAKEQIVYAGRAATAYQTITGQMRTAYAREQSIYGGVNPTFARGQVSFWIGQRAFTAGRIHFSVHIRQTNVFAAMKRVAHTTEQLVQVCRARDRDTKTPRFVVKACTAFLGQVPIIAQNNASIAAAYRHAQAMWKQQRQEQKAIEWRAEQAAR